MAALALAPIDPDTPSFDGYESGGSYGHCRQLQLEDTIIPDTCDEDNQFDPSFETDAEPKFKSSANSNDNSAQEVIKSDPKKNKTKNVASNTEKKSPSSADAAVAKEKRPREGLTCNASVAKKMKKKNVKKEPIPEIDEDAHVAEDDQVVEKKKKQHIKKKKKNSVSREEMKTSNDCADHEKVEEKKEKGGFADVMKACERYLGSHVVDWRWINAERMVKLEKMWVKLRGAESVFRSLQADFDAELHRVAVDAYISYEDHS
ncbi:unnamed protein product [Prunus armeniaca]|uniref:Uncharacterized protein n=1 Tax=Prunus armeniaca TaxID=36596 RepID=A0A6J5X5D3_PRUAR|nr:unnamed protein product [Prunus armeniaca]CAB4309039.1 unnamed protein product [Prunus armeniaca]